MLELLLGIAIGAASAGAGTWLALRAHSRELSTVRSLLDSERAQTTDLHDRLAAKTWPEYKAVTDVTPEVDAHPGMVYATDPTGTYGEWIPREQAIEQGLTVD